MLLHIKVSADTMCGVVLCDVPEMFTHPFTEGTLGMSSVLFKTHLTCNAINNVDGFAANNIGWCCSCDL